MKTITVTRTIDAPRHHVFDAYVDHERLQDLPMVRSATVVVPGTDDKNGRGAIRVVDGGIAVLREEITAFQRPTLMEYRIRQSRPAVEHRLGRVEFTETPAGTHVSWTSTFELRNKLLRVAEPAFAVTFRLIFTLTLRHVGDRAKASTEKANTQCRP